MGTDPTIRYVQISLAMKQWALEALEAIVLGRHHGDPCPTRGMPRLTREKKLLPLSRREVAQIVEIVTLDPPAAYTVPTRNRPLGAEGAVSD